MTVASSPSASRETEAAPDGVLDPNSALSPDQAPTLMHDGQAFWKVGHRDHITIDGRIVEITTWRTLCAVCQSRFEFTMRPKPKFSPYRRCVAHRRHAPVNPKPQAYSKRPCRNERPEEIAMRQIPPLEPKAPKEWRMQERKVMPLMVLHRQADGKGGTEFRGWLNGLAVVMRRKPMRPGVDAISREWTVALQEDPDLCAATARRLERRARRNIAKSRRTVGTSNPASSSERRSGSTQR